MEHALCLTYLHKSGQISTGYSQQIRNFYYWHEFFQIKRNLSMIPDLAPYATILKEGKWVSKADFIYLIKSRYDCSDEKLRGLLRLLYNFSFHQIARGQKGEILIQ
jgi:hypothetical protein